MEEQRKISCRRDPLSAYCTQGTPRTDRQCLILRICKRQTARLLGQSRVAALKNVFETAYVSLCSEVHAVCCFSKLHRSRWSPATCGAAAPPAESVRVRR